MRGGGRILAKILKKLEEIARPGISTQDIEKLARELVSFYKVKPSFLGYNGFPAFTCVSVNEEVVHCVPSRRRIKKGDLVSIDMGIIYQGFNLDSALTVAALDSDEEYEEWSRKNPARSLLMKTTKESLNKAISVIKTGIKTGVISNTIQKIVEKNGFTVIKELSGHGIGRNLHEEPRIPNFGRSNSGIELKEGMVLAIEPIVGTGSWRLKEYEDVAGYVTVDNSCTAHFEHTVAVTATGAAVLTQE